MPSSCKTHQSMGTAHLTEGFLSPGTYRRSQAFLEQVYMAYNDKVSGGPHNVSKELLSTLNHLTSRSKSLTAESVENEEASLVLEVVCAQREVHRAEKSLAECIVQEHEKIANLHRFKARRMQDSVDQMDLDVGWINATFINHSRSHPSAVPVSASTLSQTVSGSDRELVGCCQFFRT